MYNETDTTHDHNRAAEDPVVGAAPLAKGYPTRSIPSEPGVDSGRHHDETPPHDGRETTASGDGRPAVPEGMTEHKDGESVKEWLKNDWEQTKKDLHLTHNSKD